MERAIEGGGERGQKPSVSAFPGGRDIIADEEISRRLLLDPFLRVSHDVHNRYPIIVTCTRTTRTAPRAAPRFSTTQKNLLLCVGIDASAAPL